MEIKKINYPYEPDTEYENMWYKFGCSECAVSIDDTKIEEWINECIQRVKEQLENGVEAPYAFCASGNTIVICFYSQDIEDEVFNDNNYFSVIVAKNYEQGDFFINDIKINKSNEKNSCCKIEDVTLNDIISSVKNEKTIILNGYEINVRKVD